MRSDVSVPILAVSGVIFVALLAIAATSGVSEPFDHVVIEAVRGAALRDALSPLAIITELGSTWAVTAVAILALLLGIAMGLWMHGVAAAVTIGLAALGNATLKTSIARARPELLDPLIVERGFSFPSGHAGLSMVAYGILAVLVSRTPLPPAARRVIVVSCGIVIFLVGISRVWLGVHYPTDVLAGWAAGAVIVLVYARLTRQVSPEPAAAVADVDPAAPRFDPPGTG